MTAVPNPRMRVAGVVLIVVAVLGYLGAFTGLDADGAGSRIALGVVATVLLPVGVLLVRSRTPALSAIGLDARGLVVTVADQDEDVLPWSAIRVFGLRRVGPTERGERAGLRSGGLLVSVSCRSADVPARLRAFTVQRSGDVTGLLFGLRRPQAIALRRQLPDFADELRERAARD